jgi:hypothetical protein
MVVPIILILLAALGAGAFGFGTRSIWGSYPHGLELIVWSRRLEWPILITVVLLCTVLIVMVIAGKKRVEWLVGLVPVVALLWCGLPPSAAKGPMVVEDPPWIQPLQASQLPENDLVIGVVHEGQALAFPCTSLFRFPVVIRTSRSRQLVLIWSAYANRAMAFITDRDIRAADLSIVCSPGNALLIYNDRFGEFINGITGLTPAGKTPTGFLAPVGVVQTTIKNWETLHPRTLIAALRGADGDYSQPLRPEFNLPGTDPALKDSHPICLVASTQPIAVASTSITDRPLNLTSGPTSLLLVRIDGLVRAYDRELPGDLIPRFAPFTDVKNPNVAWIDSDTNSEWTASGSWVTGSTDLHGQSLRPIPVEDGLYWNVMKFWYPDLHEATESEIAAGVLVQHSPAERPSPRHRRMEKR